jgi:hypothetical protein
VGCVPLLLVARLKAADPHNGYGFCLQQWHPDRHRGDDLAKRRFQQIQEAYEGKPVHVLAAAPLCMVDMLISHGCVLPAVLIDSRRRETYDLKLVHLLDVEVCMAVAVLRALTRGLCG